MNATRERIRRYVRRNPNATLREIAAQCNVSSPSNVKFHLDRLDYEDFDKAAFIEENIRLRKRVADLEKRLAKIADLAGE